MSVLCMHIAGVFFPRDAL